MFYNAPSPERVNYALAAWLLIYLVHVWDVAPQPMA
jgi:hypothetical protein